jgi:hypothetical protein
MYRNKQKMEHPRVTRALWGQGGVFREKKGHILEIMAKFLETKFNNQAEIEGLALDVTEVLRRKDRKAVFEGVLKP